mgnify:CR=1 FL=1
MTCRGRLINLDDPLLEMEAFSYGAFNRTRIIINADELDDNLTSTREAVRDSIPFTQLKEYIKKKFNNEVRKYYFEQERKLDQEKSVSYRMAQTAYTTSKRQVYNFIQKYYEDRIINPIFIILVFWCKITKYAFDMQTQAYLFCIWQNNFNQILDLRQNVLLLQN